MEIDDVWLDRAPHSAARDSRLEGAPIRTPSATTFTGPNRSVSAKDSHRCTNLARFDLVSIRLAVLCAEWGSLSVAARSANMSKSNASHRLSNLELGVGTQLFLRDHRGLHPTEAGSVFVAHGSAILQRIDQLDKQLASLKRSESAACAVLRPSNLTRLL
ncbi:MAG: LysR family transcriptional regulator [Burkholderiales bacterium]